MVLHVSPHIVARINAVVEAEGFPDADTLLDHLLAPLETGELDPETMTLLQVGIDEAARGEVMPLTDDLLRSLREEAMKAYEAGERAAPHVRP